MRIIYFIAVFLFLASCQKAIVKSYNQTEQGVIINTDDGTLGIYPLADDAVRIKYLKDTLESLPELIVTSEIEVPDFTVEETSLSIKVKGKKIRVIIDKRSGNISFADSNGMVFLYEIPGSRKLISDSIQGEPCYLAEQSFNSPSGEYIFGLGQFQDGNFNLKSVSRRLTHVNSQIALPFIYSSRGYGLLWHQYGMTDFNPTANHIELTKLEQEGGSNEAIEVTTTSGTQSVFRNQSLYEGIFEIPEQGEYSFFLDLGTMANRHFVSIDGNPVINESNMWLPPSAGVLTALKAGEHKVQLICKSDNIPDLSWNKAKNSTTFRSPVTKKLDYIVFYGPSADEVIASYRNLSGNAPLFPQWAYGFWQCRERYSSGNQLVETVKEFRDRKLPLDVIVQDWQYWGSRGWGVPQFDETNYPDPSGFIKELHDLNAHFNISIWSNPDKNSELGKTFVSNGLFIPNTKWLDYFNPETRKAYWQTLNANMFEHGVDSWWMDAVEPENDALKGEMTFAGPGDFNRLVYPLMVSKAVYEGQREVTTDKRVCILTRSAFLGQQRYGIINWSGDIGGNWDAYKRQIVAGLNYSVSGMPYWTTDIGGFFRPGRLQYSDEKYHELLIRWFQWGTFNPIFRVHGYMSETEPWKYGDTVENCMRKMLDLRYQLLPYIYSWAWEITKNGSTMMRPLVMDFREDKNAIDQPYEYLFGKSILVAPVIASGVNERTVYLPGSSKWYDFWTGKTFTGEQTITIDAPLEKIPLFIKAGSIVPIGPNVQYAAEKKWEDLEIRIFIGANGAFTLYEDEGDTYNYEDGAYSTIAFSWNDAKRTLTIGNREGSFNGMLTDRRFNVVLVSEDKIIGQEISHVLDKAITYNGKKLVLEF